MIVFSQKLIDKNRASGYVFGRAGELIDPKGLLNPGMIFL